MIRLKNVRPGVVLIPGHRLRLAPGGTAEIEEMTPEVERALATGVVVRLDAARAASGPAAEPPPPFTPTASPSAPAAAAPPAEEPTLPEVALQDFARLPQSEAAHRISHEHDAKKLRAILAADRRPRVQDAIRRRLAELEPAGVTR